MNAVEVAKLRLVTGSRDLKVDETESFIYAAGEKEGIYKIDIRDLNNVTLNETINTAGFEVWRFQFMTEANKIFLASEAAISVLDISDP